MLSIHPASSSPHLWEAGLELLCQSDSAAEKDAQRLHWRQAYQRGELLLDDLLLAETAGHLVGALLTITQSDGTQLIWPPAVVAGASQPDRIADQLMRAAFVHLQDRDLAYYQCLLDPQAEQDRRFLEQYGFRTVTDLQIMSRGRLQAGEVVESGPEWITRPFTPGSQQELEWLLEQTWEHSLDCPEID